MLAEIEHVMPGKTSAFYALWPIGLATALSLTGDATLYAVLPTHPADAGIVLGSVGLILSINRFIRLATNAPAGWLYDRLADRRLLFLGALGIGVLSTAIYALSAGLLPLLLGRLLWGLAWSGIWVGGNAIVLQMAPARARGHWVGIYQLWFFLGSALGTFLGGVLTDAVGYRQALWIGAGLSAAGMLAVVLAPSRQLYDNHDSIALRAGSASERASTTGRAAISPALWTVALAQGVNRLLVAGVLAATLGLVVQQSVGTGLHWGAWQIGAASVTGGLLTARTLVSLVGAPLAGTLSDRLSRHWELLIISLLLGALGMGLLAMPGGLALLAGTIAGAAAGGSIQALTTTLAGDLSAGRTQGQNLGLLYTAGDLGSAVGPLAAYALLPITGLPAIYLGCALLMLAVAAWAAITGQAAVSHHL
jgi:MFS family permease